MEKVKTIARSAILQKAGLFALFLAICIFAPFLKIQLITGTIVNAVLFFSTICLGFEAGVLIGFLPSIVSAYAGLLPPPLLPMIPYIILGNAILVLTFNFLKKRSFLAVLAASFLKSSFLFLTSSFIIGFFIHKTLPKAIIGMMGWPQLFTALAGGALAIFLSRFVNFKRGK